MSDQDFLNCESLLYSGHYKEAFNCFTSLLQVGDISDKEASDIYNYLGILITIEPSLSKEEDESGLSFYLQAVRLNGKNTDAWLNIAGSFGNIQPVDHNNVEAFLNAMAYLLNVLDELSESQKETVNSRLDKYKGLFSSKLESMR